MVRQMIRRLGTGCGPRGAVGIIGGSPDFPNWGKKSPERASG